MIYQIWLFLKDGLPLWSRMLAAGDHSEEGLVTGVLGATSMLTKEALGMDLQDLIMKGRVLHKFEILRGNAYAAIYMDERVPKERINAFLVEADRTLIQKF